MKFLVCPAFLLVAGLCLAQSENYGNDGGNLQSEVATHERRTVLKRVVRNAFSGMSNQYLMLFEATIISNCKKNGQAGAADSLQNTYDDLKLCLIKKRLFITPKNEFLTHIDDCSRDAVKKTKVCLQDNQKYFPDFILDLVKSVVNFLYDDIDYMKNEVAQCIPRINNYSAQRKYIQCLSDTSQSRDTSNIPPSRADFCQTFLPASYCFTDMLKDSCTRSSNLDKFREDYINAMKNPCSKKEN